MENCRKIMHLKYLVLFSVLPLLCCSCAYPSEAMILEKKFTIGLSKEEIVIGNQDYLRISGLCGHSSFVVHSIELIYGPNSVQVLVRLIPAGKKGLTGNFDVVIPVLEKFDSIYFGKESDLMWER